MKSIIKFDDLGEQNDTQLSLNVTTLHIESQI
jgi:hypothetical protein